jgi:hypothetical protein
VELKWRGVEPDTGVIAAKGYGTEEIVMVAVA